VSAEWVALSTDGSEGRLGVVREGSRRVRHRRLLWGSRRVRHMQCSGAAIDVRVARGAAWRRSVQIVMLAQAAAREWELRGRVRTLVISWRAQVYVQLSADCHASLSCVQELCARTYVG
jgi:hypothetical protein